MTIKHLREKRAKLNAEELSLRKEAGTLLATAREAGKLTDDQRSRDDAIKARLSAIAAERAALDVEIENAERLADLERSTPTTASAPAATAAVRDGFENDPKHGYANVQEMIADIFASTQRGRLSPRLASVRRAQGPMATAGSDEHTTLNDPYGGFLIPQGLMPGVMKLDPDADPLAPLTRKVDMTGVNLLKINARVDKDHSSSVSGGLQVYRRVETQTVAATRTKFEQVELQKHELFGVTYAAEELLKQSPIAFASLLSGFFNDEFAAKVFEERLNGNGVGMYHGIANSPALVTISKESGQAADTIVFANIVKMIARCWRYGQAVWLANPTVYPQLRQMVQPGSTIPIFATGQAGIATLEGRPIYFHERMAALGDLGDIGLVNPAEYLESADDGVMSAESMHVRFLEHERTFKFWTENAGAGWWRTPLTPKRGDTLSPFVYLQAR